MFPHSIQQGTESILPHHGCRLKGENVELHKGQMDEQLATVSHQLQDQKFHNIHDATDVHLYGTETVSTTE